jgi:hypothetical protein
VRGRCGAFALPNGLAKICCGLAFARKSGAAFEYAAGNQHFAEGVFLALGIKADG